ncbi:MAG: chromosome segregation protein SMC, partial [Clostridia bacterium]|nr:chromosome segregation protein SMC [Clostridia bacterium]
IAIARKYGYNFKIVTLDGQIVNTGGSMTGGSLSKNAGILSRSGEIAKLRDAADKILAQIESENVNLKSVREAIASLDAELLSAKGELTTANEDKIRVLSEIRRVSEQKDAHLSDINKLNAEKELLNGRISELSNIEKSANIEIGENDNRISVLTAELNTMTGGRDATSQQRESLSAKAAEISANSFTLKKEVEMLKASVSEIEMRMSGQSKRADEMQVEIDNITKQNANIEVIISDLIDQTAALRERSKQALLSIEQYNNERDEAEKEINNLRQSERDSLSDREKLSGELARLEERKSAMVRDYDDTIRKLYDEYGLTRTEAESRGIVIEDISTANKRLSELKNKIKSLGSVNVSAIEEYKEVKERYEFLTEQLADVENSRTELNKLINQLTGKMQTLFVNRFNEINKHFSIVFAELFGGGTAELRLSDPDNVLESGIEIIVQPPGKNISIIEQLSGGEKALIAISIYFAIMKVNPPPFCILDEVDAALDDVNVVRFAEYLRRMSDATQYIVVTHRRGSMEEADMLYGVTMQEKGISKLLELNVSEIEHQMSLDN